MACKTLQQKTTHKGRENSKLQVSRGRRVGENAFGILVSRFRVLLGTIEQRPKVARDIVLTCVVLHDMLRTHQGRVDRVLNPAADIADVQSKQSGVCARWQQQKSFEGSKTSVRPTDRLLQSSGCIGWARGQHQRCVNQLPWRQKELTSNSSFKDYLIIPRTFI